MQLWHYLKTEVGEIFGVGALRQNEARLWFSDIGNLALGLAPDTK